MNSLSDLPDSCKAIILNYLAGDFNETTPLFPDLESLSRIASLSREWRDNLALQKLIQNSIKLTWETTTVLPMHFPIPYNLPNDFVKFFLLCNIIVSDLPRLPFEATLGEDRHISKNLLTHSMMTFIDKSNRIGIVLQVQSRNSSTKETYFDETLTIRFKEKNLYVFGSKTGIIAPFLEPSYAYLDNLIGNIRGISIELLLKDWPKSPFAKLLLGTHPKFIIPENQSLSLLLPSLLLGVTLAALGVFFRMRRQ